MAVGDVVRIRLEGIAPLGDAVGRFEGKTVFVQGGAPDETVCCRITEDHKSWAKADILEIIEPSLARIDSACPFYNKCGGCNLQHINYDTQIKIKSSILNETFTRTAGLQPPPLEVFSSSPWEYRNRMQFHCLREKSKGDGKRFGFKSRSGTEIVPITDCPIAVSSIREKTFDLVLPVEKDRFTVFSKDDVFLNEGGQQKGKIKLLEKEISIDAGLFFQSNCLMLEKLILELQKVAEYADNKLPMADLYCGVGTFALFLSHMFQKIILAEENKAAVSLARENLKGLDAEYFALRDSQWQPTLLAKNKQIGQGFGFAVLDPPRAGLNPKLATALAQDGPPLLAYVSCDAASLARDTKILTNGGYTLKDLKFFDFYPQTSHIETLAVFKK